MALVTRRERTEPHDLDIRPLLDGLLRSELGARDVERHIYPIVNSVITQLPALCGRATTSFI